MGWVSNHHLKPAGNYLLKLLAEKGSVRCGEHFYDDSDDLQDRLREAIAASEGEFDADEDPCLYVEFAAGQLEDAGLVERHELPGKLSDGEQDYTLTLTEKGRAFVASGQEFRYRDMNL